MTEEYNEKGLNESRQDGQESNSQTHRSSKEVRRPTPQTFVKTNTALTVPKENVASYSFYKLYMSTCIKFAI